MFSGIKTSVCVCVFFFKKTLKRQPRSTITEPIIYFNKNILSNEKKVYTSEKDNSVHLQIANFTDILEKIIPFFELYPVQGLKSLDFEDFKKVCNIVKSKKHLTPEGVKTILEIKSNMNQNRIH